MVFTITPLSNTPRMRTILPFVPFKAILCTKGTSGNGFISNSSVSSDPTVYRSMICVLVGALYISAPVFGVQTVESESFLSPSGDSALAGTSSMCSSTVSMQAIEFSTVSMALPHFPGFGILDTAEECLD